MAQATLEDPMNRDPALSIAFIIARNGDPVTMALRRGEDLSPDDMIQLNESSSSKATSEVSSSTGIFSSGEPSIVTKPTSYGTEYLVHDYSKGNCQFEYTSSLSASQGSEPESEDEQDNAPRTALLGTGAWSYTRHGNEHCLRRGDNAKVRLSRLLPGRKKPLVVIDQPIMPEVAACSNNKANNGPLPSKAEVGQCPRHRIPRQHYVVFGSVCIVFSVAFLGGILIGRGMASTKPMVA